MAGLTGTATMTATAISTPASPGCGRPSSRRRSNSLILVSFRQPLQHTRQKHEPRKMDGSMIPTKLSRSVAFCWQIAPHSGGGGGMPTRPDPPQSVQSVPRAHVPNSLPGPPSSQSRSSAKRHLLEHIEVPLGFSGGGGGAAGWADTESASDRKESIHSINFLSDVLAWTDACARQRMPCHSGAANVVPCHRRCGGECLAIYRETPEDANANPVSESSSAPPLPWNPRLVFRNSPSACGSAKWPHHFTATLER